MQKDEQYHASAIKYNDELAMAAGKLADELTHPTIAGWSRSVSKQHEFHAGRHRKALAKLRRDNSSDVKTEDGGEDRVVEESIADQQKAFAEEQSAKEESTVDETPPPGIPPSTGVDTPAAPDPAQAAEPVSNQGQEV
jgi:rubrerythrin